MRSPVRVAIAGAGDRGTIYAGWIAAHPDRARVVAVAEFDRSRRDLFAQRFGGAPHADWSDLVGLDIDAVLICTQDRDHAAAAVAFLEAGKHVLCEKPMAPTADECREIVAAADRSTAIFAVAHVLRYTEHTKVLRRLLAENAIGQIQAIERTEPIGWYHFAHSYVRGSWADAGTSGPLLLTKACHDIDWMSYVVGPIRRASSFGSLRYFTPEYQPDGAADRCLDCALRDGCAYSATRIYLDAVRAGQAGWPVSTITTDRTAAGVERALREGPYGRCAWQCGNTVVDRQVVAMEFDGGITGTFQLVPFTDKVQRRTWLYGDQGELWTDGTRIEVLGFRTSERTVIDVEVDDVPGTGHAGGDWGLLDEFIGAVEKGDPRHLSSDAHATLASHLAVFQIERARLTGTVVEMDT